MNCLCISSSHEGRTWCAKVCVSYGRNRKIYSIQRSVHPERHQAKMSQDVTCRRQRLLSGSVRTTGCPKCHRTLGEMNIFKQNFSLKKTSSTRLPFLCKHRVVSSRSMMLFGVIVFKLSSSYTINSTCSSLVKGIKRYKGNYGRHSAKKVFIFPRYEDFWATL